MSSCSSCGLTLGDHSELCINHTAGENEWSQNNRVICNFIHRGVIPKRLSQDDRGDENFWTGITVDPV